MNLVHEHILPRHFEVCSCLFNVFPSKDPNSSSIDECYQVLLNLVDMNLAVLKGTDPSALDQSIRTTLTGKLFLKCARICIENIWG